MDTDIEEKSLAAAAAFLLVSGPQDNYWRGVLGAALSPLGGLRVVTEADAVRASIEGDYQAIIVDASVIEDFALLTARIRAQCPAARVVIVTTSLTWQRAREAFHAGAVDYIYKSPYREELRAAIEAALTKPVLPWRG